MKFCVFVTELFVRKSRGSMALVRRSLGLPCGVVGTAWRRGIGGLASCHRGGQGHAPPHGQSAAWLSRKKDFASAVAVQRSVGARIPRAGFHSSGPAGSENKEKGKDKGQGKEEEGKRLPSDDPSQLPGHFFTSASWFAPRRSLNPIAGRHSPACNRACS